MDVIETTGITDEVVVELVKGPDPDEWGTEQTVAPAPERPLTVEDLPEGVKGPDPEKWGAAQAGIVEA